MIYVLKRLGSDGKESVSHSQWSTGEKKMLILFLFKYRREMNPFQSLIDARLIDLEDEGGWGWQIFGSKKKKKFLETHGPVSKYRFYLDSNSN